MKGKVALVTGASAGIGEAVAQMLAREGASVVVTARRKAKLDRVVDSITAAGGRALAVVGSVTDEAHAREAVQQAVRAVA
jgi:NADP-dependent 3-hydroxy acid dehydrogenase YdfG